MMDLGLKLLLHRFGQASGSAAPPAPTEHQPRKFAVNLGVEAYQEKARLGA